MFGANIKYFGTMTAFGGEDPVEIFHIDHGEALNDEHIEDLQDDDDHHEEKSEDTEVAVIPIESSSIDDRRNQFFVNLKRGDILIFRVLNDTLPEHLKLLVLNKNSDVLKLDDLSVIMLLPRSEEEKIGVKLQSYDLIRGMVISANLEERKICIVVDRNVLGEDADNEYLGKISEEDLAFYLGEVITDIDSFYVLCGVDHVIDLRNRFLERNGMEPSCSSLFSAPVPFTVCESRENE